MDQLSTRTNPSIPGPSHFDFAVLGFLAGLAVPAIFIAYVLGSTWIYNAQHPLAPGQGRCATGPAMMIIVAILTAPFFGAIGSILGWQLRSEIAESQTKPSLQRGKTQISPTCHRAAT